VTIARLAARSRPSHLTVVPAAASRNEVWHSVRPSVRPARALTAASHTIIIRAVTARHGPHRTSADGAAAAAADVCR